MYPSDITDKEWSILAPFVVQGKMGRPRKHEIQKIINGIRYVMKSGCQWRLSPKDFPPWQTVYDYYLRWRKNGKWQGIHDTLVKQVREKAGKKPAPTVGIIRQSICKDCTKRGFKGYDAGKKVKGRKRHITTDTIGLVLSCNVHSAGIQDRDGAKAVLAQAKTKYPTIVKFFADGGYAGALQIWCFLTLIMGGF